MNILKVIILITMLSSKSESFKKISTFWHISDVFWKSATEECTGNIGECVNQLLNPLVEKSDKHHPDFVLWSSVGGPHLQGVIQQMKKIFKNILIFASLAPVKLPAADNFILYYQNLSGSFGDWLDIPARETFSKAGYYSHILEIPRRLQVIILNTAVFCKFHIASQLDDPAHQWSWLSLELLKARKANRKVYLLLSATPGITKDFTNRTFAAKHNRHYIRVVQTYTDVIIGQFGGFEEGDKFHIFYDKNEKGCNWLMLSPPFPKSARLYFYDTETLAPLDYVQFYRIDNVWHVQYRFSSYYLVPNILVFSLELIVTRMQENENYFIKYCLARYPLKKHDVMRYTDCTTIHLCKIIAVDYSAYLECIAQEQSQYLYKYNRGICTLVQKLFLVKFVFVVFFINSLYLLIYIVLNY